MKLSRVLPCVLLAAAGPTIGLASDSGAALTTLPPSVVHASTLKMAKPSASSPAYGTSEPFESVEVFSFLSSKVGYGLSGGGGETYPVETTNSGANWHVAGPVFWNAASADAALVSNVVTSSTGVVVAYGGPESGAALDTSNNSGHTWWSAEIGGGTPAAAVVGNDILALVFSKLPSPTSFSPIWVYDSDNGGKTWTYRSTIPGLAGNAAEIVRPTPTTAYVLAANYQGTPDPSAGLAVTTNDGATWTRIADPCASAYAPQMPENEQLGATSASSLWLLCGAPKHPSDGAKALQLDRVERSTNAGATWSTVARHGVTSDGQAPFASNGQLGGIGSIDFDAFMSSQVAWLIYSPGGPIEETTNGGANWTQTAPPSVEGDEPSFIDAEGSNLFVLTVHAFWEEVGGVWSRTAYNSSNSGT